jgi:glycosyltransferase involved in cell wall biosynthesis
VGGIPEIMGADNPALARVDAGDLTRLMGTALTEPERMRGWMPAGKTFRTRFSARTMAANVLSAYRAAIESRSGQGKSDGALSSVS